MAGIDCKHFSTLKPACLFSASFIPAALNAKEDVYSWGFFLQLSVIEADNIQGTVLTIVQ